MTTGALAITAAVVLIATSRIPRLLLAVLVIAWLGAFNHTAPGVLAGAAGEAWEWVGELWVLVGRLWDELPRVPQ